MYKTCKEFVGATIGRPRLTKPNSINFINLEEYYCKKYVFNI